MRKTIFNLKIFIFLTVFCAFTLAPAPIFAHVNASWDWNLENGEPDRTLYLCAGRAVRYSEEDGTVDIEAANPGLPPSWSGWLIEAADIWNNANIGWKFEPVEFGFPPCQVMVVLADISEDIHGGGAGAPVDTDEDGKADLMRIIIDLRLENTLENLPVDQDAQDEERDGWSTEGGATLDPIDFLVHELSHALRLDHHPDSKQSDAYDDDLTDPRKPGEHRHELSKEDLKEANEASGSVEDFYEFESDNSGQSATLGGIEMEIPEDAFAKKPAKIHLNILDGVATPDPLALPDEYLHVLGSGTIYFRTDQKIKEPLKFTIPYADDEILGGDGMYVGDLHAFVPPAVDEATMAVFHYVMEPFGVEQEGSSHWELVEGSVVDEENNTVAFETDEPGIYGIAAQPAVEQPSEEERATIRGEDVETQPKAAPDSESQKLLMSISLWGLILLIIIIVALKIHHKHK